MSDLWDLLQSEGPGAGELRDRIGVFQSWDWAQSRRAAHWPRAVMGKAWRQFLKKTFYELLSGPEGDTQRLSDQIQSRQDKRVRSNVFSGDSGGRVGSEAKGVLPPSPEHPHSIMDHSRLLRRRKTTECGTHWTLPTLQQLQDHVHMASCLALPLPKFFHFSHL